MQSRPLLGIALALAAAAGYGFAPPLARVSFENGVPTWESALFRATAVVVIFSCVALATRASLAVPRGGWPALLALAVSTGFVSFSYLASVEFIPIGLSAIVFYTYPIVVLLASPVLEARPLGFHRVALALLAFAGLVVAIGPSFGDLDIRGILFAMTASISAAAQLFAARVVSARMPALAFGLVANMLIWPFMLAVAFWWSGGTLRLLTEGAVAPLGYLTVFALGCVFVATFFVHMKSLVFAPASTVAPFFNLEPVITMAIAALLLGERLTAHQYAGGAMVLAALILAGFEGRGRKAMPLRADRGEA